MPEFKKTQSQEQLTPVIKQYKEQGRSGETYTAQRLPPGERRDFLPRIKRKSSGEPR
jgi:hypothetical protein